MNHIFKKLHFGSSHDPNRSNEISSSSSPPSTSSSSISPSTDNPHHHHHHRNNTTTSTSSSSSSHSPISPSTLSPTPPPITSLPFSSTTNGTDRADYFSSEEEFQVQLALAISASSSNSDSREDRDKDQIREATLLSLGRNINDLGRVEDQVGESLSRRYWDYNVLDYEEKVVDGLYDIYGRLSVDSASQGKMPSLADLQRTHGDPGFEVVVVNRAIDPFVEELDQVARCMALDCPATEVGILVQRLADVVTEHMGGSIRDANIMLARWMERTAELRISLHSSVLPIGSLNIGLSRHWALLFKVYGGDDSDAESPSQNRSSSATQKLPLDSHKSSSDSNNEQGVLKKGGGNSNSIAEMNISSIIPISGCLFTSGCTSVMCRKAYSHK